MNIRELSRDESTPIHHQQTRNGFAIMHFNQDLIAFADSKANTLIVINSIALASATALSPAVPPEWKMAVLVLRIGFLLACMGGIVLCMMVVLARTINPDEGQRPDLIFYGDILSRCNADQYAYEYTHTNPEEFLHALLLRNYRLAGIADRKFRLYNVAQQTTVLACMLWMCYLLVGQRFS